MNEFHKTVKFKASKRIARKNWTNKRKNENKNAKLRSQLTAVCRALKFNVAPVHPINFVRSMQEKHFTKILLARNHLGEMRF